MPLPPATLSSMAGDRTTPWKEMSGLSSVTWASWVAGPQPKSMTIQQPWMVWLMRAEWDKISRRHEIVYMTSLTISCHIHFASITGAGFRFPWECERTGDIEQEGWNHREMRHGFILEIMAHQSWQSRDAASNHNFMSGVVSAYIHVKYTGELKLPVTTRSVPRSALPS